jgi:hypothetical protein
MDKFFQFVNVLPMPLWLGMMFAPDHPWTRRGSRSSSLFILVAANYLLSLISALILGRKNPDAPEKIDFTSLEGLSAGLGTKEGALGAWTHMLALDLFTGAWIFRESRRLDAPAWVRIPALFFTLMSGPFGLLLFLIWRMFGAGKGDAVSE